MGLCEGIFYADSKPMVTATARGEIKTRCTPLSQMPAKPETALWGQIVWEGLGCAALPLLGLGAQSHRSAPAQGVSSRCWGRSGLHGALTQEAAWPRARVAVANEKRHC